MKRKIITIDEELCIGCGLCAQACHEGAIGMVDGKAKLLRDDYCDGLGNCLPVCPTGAITFEEREAAQYDQAAVNQNQNAPQNHSQNPPLNAPQHLPQHQHQHQHEEAPSGGCPGSRAVTLKSAAPTLSVLTDATSTPAAPTAAAPTTSAKTVAASAGNFGTGESELMQWPVQLKLLPLTAPYYQGAHLLIAADCAAFANGEFHSRFIKGKITMIGCPKLDEGSYAEKLTSIMANNDIASVTVVRMEVPCCGGLANAAIEALKNCGKMIPWQVVTLSAKGDVLS